MLELALLAIAVVTAASFGRARGGPLAGSFMGLAAAAGYFILRYALPGLVPSKASDSDVVRFLLPWGWVAAALLFARFGLGRNKAKPGQHWNCPNCNSLNREFAVRCETCGQAYAPPDGTDSDRTEP